MNNLNALEIFESLLVNLPELKSDGSIGKVILYRPGGETIRYSVDILLTNTNYLIVTPSFIGFDIKIIGVNRNQIKDYLYEVFHDCFE